METKNKRGGNKPPRKKNFKIYKDNTLRSLNEVEDFLNNFQNFLNIYRFNKILK